MESLDRRLETLEALLRESRHIPEHHVPPLDGSSGQLGASKQCSPIYPPEEPVSIFRGDVFSSDLPGANLTSREAQEVRPQQDIFKKLLSKNGHLALDKGTLRYFGPTTNLHIFSEDDEDAQSPAALLAEQSAIKMIRELALDTHDYLLNLFWSKYNSIIEVVPQAAFLESYGNGGGQYYSLFLHITMLAVGFRFADKSKMDIGMLMSSQYVSTLHLMAKQLIEPALEAGGLTAIQGFLLLSDLDCGCGKDIVGWMYGGMSQRFSLTLGSIHANSIRDGVPPFFRDGSQSGRRGPRSSRTGDRSTPQDRVGVPFNRQVRAQPTFCRASVLLLTVPRYWALFSGRPTAVKTSDLEMTALSRNFARFGEPVTRSRDSLIYESLIELMEIAGHIADSNARRTSNVDNSAYATMVFLEGQMREWHTSLPAQLQWKAANVKDAPLGFFLLQ